MQKLFFITAFVLTIAALSAEPDYSKYTVTGAMGRPEALYAAGETMKFQFQVLDDGKPVAGSLQIIRVGDDGARDEFIAEVSAEKPLEYTSSIACPGFVMVKARLINAAGTTVKRPPSPGAAPRVIEFGLAGGVSPEKLEQGVPEPADFDEFWAGELQRLAEVPVELLEKKLVEATETYEVFDVKISCAGERPVSGYLTVPTAVKNGAKFPAEVFYSGYGVGSAPMIKSASVISLSINAHGIENGREREYYRELEKTVLKSYGFSNEENQTPQTCYFNGMVLRAVRAAEFTRSLPEWDGQSLTVRGGSQGAFQSTAVAALSSFVTRCSLNVPWMCDLGGITVNRARGWRPDFEPGLRYYDTVNFAKRVKCPTAITAGLSDWVCPPSGVQVLYNNLTCEKELKFTQGLDHSPYVGFVFAQAPFFTLKAPAK